MRKLLLASCVALLTSPALAQDAPSQCTQGAPTWVSTLCRSYTSYVRVKYCNEVRKGYLLQYVNDEELERAEVAIKAIVSKAIETTPNVDTDAIWKRALILAPQGAHLSRDFCQQYLRSLLADSPVATISIPKP